MYVLCFEICVLGVCHENDVGELLVHDASCTAVYGEIVGPAARVLCTVAICLSACQAVTQASSLNVQLNN